MKICCAGKTYWPELKMNLSFTQMCRLKFIFFKAFTKFKRRVYIWLFPLFALFSGRCMSISAIMYILHIWCSPLPFRLRAALCFLGIDLFVLRMLRNNRN